jgi:hypothetical protein
MDAGAGASILMPGESAPMVVPGAGPQNLAVSRPAAPDPGATRSRADREPGGAPADLDDRRHHVDEERHLSAREEPVWWKPGPPSRSRALCWPPTRRSPSELGPAFPSRRRSACAGAGRFRA